jgi:hypothetical protein
MDIYIVIYIGICIGNYINIYRAVYKAIYINNYKAFLVYQRYVLIKL